MDKNGYGAISKFVQVHCIENGDCEMTSTKITEIHCSVDECIFADHFTNGDFNVSNLITVCTICSKMEK